MLTRLTGGTLYDPSNGIDGECRDLYVSGGRIVAPPNNARAAKETIDVSGCAIMAGGIDMHTHIGGGKVNIARMMLPDDHAEDRTARNRHPRMGCGHAAPSTLTAGYRYVEMGYTACFEPAMLPVNARQAHLEMADTPIVDKGAYALLGNDDFLLRMLVARKQTAAINDYIAWTLKSAQALAIKVVNPGGIHAFKYNQRALDLDEANVHYQITPRTILQTLAQAVQSLGLSHPLHIHGCNLGGARKYGDDHRNDRGLRRLTGASHPFAIP